MNNNVSPGTIVINRLEANADIQRLRGARSSLESAKGRLERQVKNSEGYWAGAAHAAFCAKAREMINNINAAIEGIDDYIHTIGATVDKYQQLDRGLAGWIR